MKKNPFLLPGLLTASIAMVTLYSCEDQDANVDSVLDGTTFTENVFVSLSSDADEALTGSSLTGRFGFGLASCATRTVEIPDDEDYPQTITLDYGEIVKWMKALQKVVRS